MRPKNVEVESIRVFGVGKTGAGSEYRNVVVTGGYFVLVDFGQMFVMNLLVFDALMPIDEKTKDD